MKPKTRRYLVEITSEKKYGADELKTVLSENLSNKYWNNDQKITVEDATSAVIRKLVEKHWNEQT